MRARTAALSAALFLLPGILCAAVLLRPDPALQVDAVAVNRILRGVEEHWGDFPAAGLDASPYGFCVLDPNGVPLYSSKDAARSVWEAVESGDVILDATEAGRPLGKVLIRTGAAERLRGRERRLALLSAASFAACALLAAGYFLYLRRRVFLPFAQMRSFAARVASGNLELPLIMDRGNLFGAFTESFDLMRDELRRARAREFAAQQEKKELVASLSHDIRTPVTSIKLLCELMQVTAPPAFCEKLEIIHKKAEGIDALISNLFHAALEELGELRVQPQELDSRLLDALLDRADYLGRMEAPCPAPGCILRADPLRMEQVLDNLFANAYKYAGSPVRVTYALSDEFLSLTARDFGPGVEEDELPLLTQKFYRGREARGGGQDGAGLGLYLCRYLMEQMGGGFSCRNAHPGLAAELLIPLA